MDPIEHLTGPTADEALARLIAGNERFVRGESRLASIAPKSLMELTKGQRPYVTILGCSDSRVPPEWVFDAGLGELFVIRVAGNVYSAEIAASLQYAGVHLQTPLFVVLGHEGCGAVSAALETKHAGAQHHSRIQLLVDSIMPGLPALDPQLSPSHQLSHAIECNVRWTVEQICATPEARARLAAGREDRRRRLRNRKRPGKILACDLLISGWIHAFSSLQSRGCALLRHGVARFIQAE